MKNNVKGFLIPEWIFLPLVLAIVLSCNSCHGKADSGNKPRQAVAVAAEVVVVEPRLMAEQLMATGTVMAGERIELRNQVPGLLSRINFEEGSGVLKGQLLVKINDSDLKAQLKGLQVQYRQASDEEFRKRRLLEMKAISQEEYDLALNQLQSIEAEQELIQAQIEKTEIIAPFAGKVGLRSVSPGSYLSANSLIAVMQQTDPVKIEFSVPEKYGNHIRKGQKVYFSTSADSAEYMAGIYAVEPEIDAATRTMRVRALTPNRNGRLIPGTFARIRIVLQEKEDAIVIPSEALVNELQGSKVYVVAQGKAVSKPVTAGIRNDKEVEIRAGLEPGDSVVTTGLLQMNEGTRIKAVPTLKK